MAAYIFPVFQKNSFKSNLCLTLVYLCTSLHVCSANSDRHNYTVLNNCIPKSLPSISTSLSTASTFRDSEVELNSEHENWTWTVNNKTLHFRLKDFQLNCSFETVSIKVNTSSNEMHKTEANGKKRNASSSFVRLTDQGELMWEVSGKYNHSSWPESYCVNRDPISSTTVEFVICKPKCTAARPCVRKCCHPGEIIDLESSTCNRTTKLWTPFLYTATNMKKDDAHNYTIVYGIPKCKSMYLIQPLQSSKEHDKGDIKLNLLSNGSLVQLSDSSTIVLMPGQFCMDGFPFPENQVIHPDGVVDYSGSEWDQVAIVCAPPVKRTIEDVIKEWRYRISAFILGISAFCLLVNNVVYIILWKHKNIHEWLQFSCATSYLFAFSALAIAQTWNKEIHQKSETVCQMLGSLIHFSFLSACFWVTSMNFDLWRRFGGCRPMKTRAQPPGDKKKFLLFAMFSLGFPFLFASAALAVDSIYKNRVYDSPLPVPQLADYCYFKDKLAVFTYQKGPEGLLYIINIIFFISTVLHLRLYHNTTELARTNSNSDDRKGKLRLFTKLFIIMGVMSIFEFVSFLAIICFPKNELLLEIIFFPTDLLNSLQGVSILFIYVWKPNIINQLKVDLTICKSRLTSSSSPNNLPRTS